MIHTIHPSSHLLMELETHSFLLANSIICNPHRTSSCRHSFLTYNIGEVNGIPLG
jgi:hypothetical protein